MEKDKKKAIRALLDKRQKEKTVTFEIARQWLVGEGMLDKDGELRPQYGGEDKSGRKD
ncbi:MULTISPECIES: hypothetical protein [unclassified Mesorhizobium]|uniref:hypothetical protein n=1 Tax=unclassified Mesorhizobium TaxID=325217 RepID=UPI0003CF2A9B|nr:hypothetical protein [Mesorhizobium sp. LSJC255A00]ESX20913.1 hypothetical protein X766_06280 [Mesorhizobium sp. LSJC255A00]